MSFLNLIDSIVLEMKQHGFLLSLTDLLADKRHDNSHIPFDMLIALAIVAKLKRKTSLTDIPFSVTNAELLAEPGWNVWSMDGISRKASFPKGLCVGSQNNTAGRNG